MSEFQLQKLLKNDNPLLATSFAKRMVVKAAKARAAVARQMVCDLVPKPDKSIISMINDLFVNLKTFLPQFHLLTDQLLSAAGKIEFYAENPVPIRNLNLPDDVVLLNSCHGGLLVIKTDNPDYISDKPNVPKFIYTYKTFQALSDGINRVIKAMPGCCSYILPKVRQDYLDTVVKIIKGASSGNNKKIIDEIINQLKELSFDLRPGNNQTPVIKRTPSGSGEINRNVKKSFKYVKTERGDPIINKLFSTDEYYDDFETNPKHKLAPRGMLFCKAVDITVNNRWFSGIDTANWTETMRDGTPNPLANLVTINSYKDRFKYTIGTYIPIPGSNTQGTIRYPAKTNLLSCPYFMFFASRKLGNHIIDKNISLSLGADNRTLIPMVTQLSAEVLYWYLSNQPFLFIDMSCEIFCYRDAAGHALKTEEEIAILRSYAYTSQKQELQTIEPKTMLVASGTHKTIILRGGNRKTRYNTKKYKKRGNTKKNKRYNTKTKKHRK